MESGLSISLTTLQRSPGAVQFVKDEQSIGGCGCVVKVVLKNTIKFPIEKAVLTLQCSSVAEISAGAPHHERFVVLPT